jgi:osmotically-inducible protein OsmY
VLLTGVVTDKEWISSAEKAAWSVKGVKSVANYVTYGQALSPGQILIDANITTACKSVLLFNASVKSINYKIKTANGVVYIMGQTRSEQERTVVLQKIKEIANVKKVVSFITLIDV